MKGMMEGCKISYGNEKLPEFALFIDHKKQALCLGGENVMLQGHRSGVKRREPSKVKVK